MKTSATNATWIALGLMAFAYRVAADDGSERSAVMRIPVYPAGAPSTPNRQPVIARVEIAGQVQADLYALVRDLRGGQAVTGPYPVPILR